MNFKTIDELLEYTQNIKNKSINDIIANNNSLNNNHVVKNKGRLGNLVETEFYHYPNNNKAEADFSNLGVELKTSGLIKRIDKKNNVKIKAKERLVLSMINYMEVINEDFENSHLMKKNNLILILWYCYQKGIDFKDFKFVNYMLFSLKRDEDVIRNDFNIIKEKIKEGKAHELSEGDTTYLGACRKGQKGDKLRQQPNSNIGAPSRAFCLKNSYMNSIVAELYEDKNIGKPKKHKYLSVMDYVKEKLEPYFGMTQREIANKIGLLKTDKIPKDINKKISNKLIGKDDELEDLDDIFKNSSYIIKNTPVYKNYKPRERMSFKNLKFSDFEEEWEDSEWKLYFEETTFITICYEVTSNKSKNGDRILSDVRKFTFNSEDIDSIGHTYDMIKNALNLYENRIFCDDLNKYCTYLPTPKSFEGQIMEIMPKQSKGKGSYNSFFINDKDTIKVCFGLSKDVLWKKLLN